MAIEYPAYGQLRVSNELNKQGIMVFSGGVRSIWLRNDLNNLKKVYGQVFIDSYSRVADVKLYQDKAALTVLTA